MLLQVPMRGSKPHVSEPMKRSRAARTTSAAVGTVDAVSTWKPPTSKLRQLAAQQLAILGATAQPQCALCTAPLLVAIPHVHSALCTQGMHRGNRHWLCSPSRQSLQTPGVRAIAFASSSTSRCRVALQAARQ